MDFAAFTDPVFIKFFYASNIVAFVTWVLTIIHKNYSQVDRLWPILPIFYAWGFVFTSAYYNPGPRPDVQIRSENRKEDVKYGSASTIILEGDMSSWFRMIMMASFITMWGCRLTYNFWRKDGYKRGSEDYRWFYVKKMFHYPTWKWHLFNFGFIAFFQNWLIFGFTIPFWFIQTNKPSRNSYRQEPLNWLDLLLALVWLGFYILEVTADNQQLRFQTNKYKYMSMSLKNKKIFKENSTDEDMADYKRGFCTTGLFRYSRHPNFCGELGMWWTIAAFTISSQLSYITKNFHVMKILPFNFGFIGIVGLSLLFHKSTELTEKITSDKYPDYKEYQTKVSRVLIGLPGKMDLKKSE